MWGRELGLWGLSVPFSGVRSGCFGGEIGVQPPHLESRSGGAPKVGVRGSSRAPLPHGAARRPPTPPSTRTARPPAPPPTRPRPQPRPRPAAPRPAARPFSCGSGVSRRHRRHKLPRWRRAGGCEQRSGRAGRGAGPAAGGQGGAGLAPRTRSRKQGRPAGGRNAAADAHKVRDGQGWPGARVGGHGGAPRRGAPPRTGAWAGARPADVGLRAWEGRECPPGLGGAHADPRGWPQPAGALWLGCPLGRGRRGTPGTKPPGPRRAGTQVSGASGGQRASGRRLFVPFH